MFILPSASHFREYQLEQYQQLLGKATTKGAITFLTDCLAKFLKTAL